MTGSVRIRLWLFKGGARIVLRMFASCEEFFTELFEWVVCLVVVRASKLGMCGLKHNFLAPTEPFAIK